MDPKRLPPEVWEALCRQCGKCCAEKVDMDGVIYITKKMCRFLDTDTRRCTMYPDRFRAEPDCMSAMEGLPTMVFPADCPYTKGIANYQPPIEQWDDAEVDEAIREILGEGAV